MRSPVSLLSSSWNNFTSHVGLFAGIYIVPGVLSFAYAVLFNTNAGEEFFFESGADIAMFVVFMATLIIVNILMGIAMIKAVAHPEGMTVKGAYKAARPHFFPYLFLALLMGLVTLVGFILFIVPALIFAVWFAFSYFVLIFEDEKGVEAMKKSKLYVKGRWWAVAGRIAFLILIGFIASAVLALIGHYVAHALNESAALVLSTAANALIIPVAIGYSYYMYKDISAQHAESTEDPIPSL